MLWGTLRRTQPVSTYYGCDRGSPVDRVYIERFLEEHAGDVGGGVLEVRDARYTERFGGAQVTGSDILDIDPANEHATIVTDLGAPGALPQARFDCAIITQTLQYVSRPLTAVENLRSTLGPGGVAFITVPCASRIDPELEKADRWRFTPLGLETVLRQAGEWAELEVRGYGNVLTGVAFLMGISAEELREGELSDYDPHFPLVACARARKPSKAPA